MPGCIFAGDIQFILMFVLDRAIDGLEENAWQNARERLAMIAVLH